MGGLFQLFGEGWGFSLIATGEAIPLRGLEGVPSLPGAPQDEAGLTRKFETSHVGGATCRTTLIPRSALEKDPRHGPLFKGNPVGGGGTSHERGEPEAAEEAAEGDGEKRGPLSTAL